MITCNKNIDAAMKMVMTEDRDDKLMIDLKLIY